MMTIIPMMMNEATRIKIRSRSSSTLKSCVTWWLKRSIQLKQTGWWSKAILSPRGKVFQGFLDKFERNSLWYQLWRVYNTIYKLQNFCPDYTWYWYLSALPWSQTQLKLIFILNHLDPLLKSCKNLTKTRDRWSNVGQFLKFQNLSNWSIYWTWTFSLSIDILPTSPW